MHIFINQRVTVRIFDHKHHTTLEQEQQPERVLRQSPMPESDASARCQRARCQMPVPVPVTRVIPTPVRQPSTTTFVSTYIRLQASVHNGGYRRGVTVTSPARCSVYDLVVALRLGECSARARHDISQGIQDKSGGWMVSLGGVR